MEGTPKIQHKTLSLTSRLSRKRLNESSNGCLKTVISDNEFNSNKGNNNNHDTIIGNNTNGVARSPALLSFCTDINANVTPPHKKYANSMDHIYRSPQTREMSFSPSSFLSQTLAWESPEVGWRWNRSSHIGEPNHITESIYTQDSNLISLSSSTTENTSVLRNRKCNFSHAIRREKQRRRLGEELRRVEKAQAEETLKQRCVKLEEQLRCAKAHNKSYEDITTDNISNTCDNFLPIANINEEISLDDALVSSDSFDNFFNDSISDGLLLAATQEVESKLTALSQVSEEENVQNKNFENFSNNNLTKIISNTSNTKNEKEKRSSLYMKFLEDDCSDDLFANLDDNVLQAMQSKKQRNSLQRYKSMPMDTNSRLSKTDENSLKAKNQNTITNQHSISKPAGMVKSIKRHYSSNELNPNNLRYTGQRHNLE